MAAHRSRKYKSTKLNRIAKLAKEDKRRQFFSIAHLLDEWALLWGFRHLRKDASPGVDGVTYEEYRKDAWRRIQDLHKRLRSKRYQVQPLRRTYIPKEGGAERPISIPCLEDKIVQKAVVELLNAIYEQDFLECSYGFRPGRSPHDALDQVGRVLCRRKVSYVLEADICGYFDAIARDKLMEIIERRVSDGSILWLIRQWIKVGVIDHGQLLVTKTGTGQGQTISPLLSNIYLHAVLDEWFEEVVKPRLRGEAYEIRFADDFILCFQYWADAQRVLRVLHKRFEEFGLTLHPEKTRLIQFGRFAACVAERQGKAKPDTFDFLGFTHVCAQSMQGKFTVHVRTMRKRFRRGLREISEWCQQHRHDAVDSQSEALNRKLRGHYEYYGRPTNYLQLWKFYRAVRRIWKKWLNRRTRGKTLNWPTYAQLLLRHPLLRPHITHPWAGKGSPP
jgi:group II intron reverse transcriptase/maturase